MGSKRKKHKSPSTTSAPMRGTSATAKVSLVIAIMLFALTRYCVLYDLRPLNVVFDYSQRDIKRPRISDMEMYFDYAVRAVDLRQAPYDDFEMPYPPLAFWVTCFPRLLNAQHVPNLQDAAQTRSIFLEYRSTFRGMMFLCDLTSFAILLLIVRKRRPDLAAWAALVYALTTFILGHLLYDRLDVGLLMLLMLGAYCWTQSLEASGRTIAWSTAAFALLGMGVSFKLISMIIVPFFVLSEIHAPRRVARLTWATIALAVEILPHGRARPWILGGLLIAVAAMTTWIFPFHFFGGQPHPNALVSLDLDQHAPPSMMPAVVLGLRNGVYLGVILWMGVLLVIKSSKTGVLSSGRGSPAFRK